MSLSFNETNGSAIKSKLDYFKFQDGKNEFRMIGGILPRYVYWKQAGQANIPVECLSFDRAEERFKNAEKDWFKHYFPKKENGDDMNCSWSYSIRVIDPADGKIKMLGLKKKLFDQIRELASKPAYGDPTNVDTGWNCVVNRKKTGSHAFNVEYALDILECEVSKLTEEQKALVADMGSIDDLIPRPSSDEQKAFIETTWLAKEESNVDNDVVEDIPF